MTYGIHRLLRPLMVLGAASALAGCSSLADISAELGGFGVGAAVGAVTANPFIAVGVGLATQLALEEGIDYYQREEVEVVHIAIAEAAGSAEEGVATPWAAESDLPIVSAAGQVQVLRDFGGDIACKEIVFTDDDMAGSYFVAVICRGTDGWRWAVAEPAIDRWGNLQ